MAKQPIHLANVTNIRIHFNLFMVKIETWLNVKNRHSHGGLGTRIASAYMEQNQKRHRPGGPNTFDYLLDMFQTVLIQNERNNVSLLAHISGKRKSRISSPNIIPISKHIMLCREK